MAKINLIQVKKTKNSINDNNNSKNAAPKTRNTSNEKRSVELFISGILVV